MPPYIKDDVTARPVSELAQQRGITGQDAGRLAVGAKLAQLRVSHPLPPATGEAADKAFFDALSGEP